MYPINKILAARMTDHGISKREIAKKLFHKKIDKGLKIINDFLYNDSYNPELCEQLLKIVPVEGYIVEAFTEAGIEIKRLSDILAAEREKQKELRSIQRQMKQFEPKLIRIPGEFEATERAKKTIFNKFPLEIQIFDRDEIYKLSKVEQFEYIKSLLLEDFAYYGNKKFTPYDIVGYVFHKEYFEKYEFNVEGEITFDDNRMD